MITDEDLTISQLNDHVAEKKLRPILCPECDEEFAAADMGRHLERHREVLPPKFSKMGYPRSWLCLKGCGRHFPFMTKNVTNLKYSHDFNLHLAICDGQPPLPPRKIR